MNRTRALSLFRPFGLLAAVFLAAFAGLAPSASANDTPGNNGTVKIHNGAGENNPGEVRDEPHVCTFHLHFYFADPEQAGTWEIQEWAPTGTKGTVVLSGIYNTAGDGEDRQPEEGVYTLPDGHYKLFWDGDTNKHDKMKVFWVDCAPANSSPVPSASEAPISSASTAPSASASTAPSESASTAPSASAPGGSELPIESGAPSASTPPTGSELPIAGSPPPTGEVEGITGTPPPGATPPPTDTLDGGSTPSNDGWRVVLVSIAALLAAAAFLVPSPTAVGARVARPRRRR